MALTDVSGCQRAIADHAVFDGWRDWLRGKVSEFQSQPACVRPVTRVISN